MKNKIEKIMIILFFILFCICCEKKNSSNELLSNGNPINREIDEKNVMSKAISLQEQIKKYDEKCDFLFQEEGNFTNSGNKEILAFYQFKSSPDSGFLLHKRIEDYYINRVYCFICDEANQIILYEFEIKHYGTGSIDRVFDKIPKDILGREILWLGKTFGYIGDFNNNGKDELYFYESYSTGTYPSFYEFDGSAFISILEYVSFTVDYTGIEGAEIANNVTMVNVDDEKKIILFENNSRVKPRYVSYIWDSDNQTYKIIEDNAE